MFMPYDVTKLVQAATRLIDALTKAVENHNNKEANK